MIDLEQARRRAKDLLTALRRTDPDVRLTAAQHQLAGELGYASWPALVRDTEAFDPVSAAELGWPRITRVSTICFLDDPGSPGGARVALYRHDGRWIVPAGQRQPGEDVWDDCVLRIPLATMGFRRHGTHLLAVDHDRRHCVFWIDGGRYSGQRAHRSDAEWWTGSAEEAAALLAGQGDGTLAGLVELADHARRTLPYEQHIADVHRTLVGSYLRADTPEGGSGFGGSARDWADERGVLSGALDTDRHELTFCDVACANGHLATTMVGWGAERGIDVTPFGVDIAPELIERARELHPELAAHFLVGDGLRWRHPDGLRFDLVHMLLDVVPPERHPELVDHLLAAVVAPGGRLLLSQYGEVLPSQSAEAVVTRLGHRVAGRTAQPHRNGRPRGFPSVWVDAV